MSVYVSGDETSRHTMNRLVQELESIRVNVMRSDDIGNEHLDMIRMSEFVVCLMNGNKTEQVMCDYGMAIGSGCKVYTFGRGPMGHLENVHQFNSMNTLKYELLCALNK